MIFVLEEAEEIAEIANFPQAPAPARALSAIGPVVQDLPEEPSQPLLQDGLANHPEIITAVYLTSWSAGTSARIDYVANLAKTTELTAVVIDIKDFSGEIAYFTNVPEAFTYGAHRIKIGYIEALLKRLHEEGLYV